MDLLTAARESVSVTTQAHTAGSTRAQGLTQALHQAIRLLQHATHTDLAALADEELCHTVGVIEQAGRLTDTLRILGAGEIQARSPREAGPTGLAQRHGHTRSTHLLEQLTRVSGTEAVRRVRLGAAIRPSHSLTGEALPATYPVLAAAMIAGSIGAEAARSIVSCLTAAAETADGESLTAAEHALVETATVEPTELVALHARVWREHLDPDGAEPREETIRRRRAFRLGRETDGITPFTGAADAMLASLLKAAFTTSLSPAAQLVPRPPHHRMEQRRPHQCRQRGPALPRTPPHAPQQRLHHENHPRQTQTPIPTLARPKTTLATTPTQPHHHDHAHMTMRAPCTRRLLACSPLSPPAAPPERCPPGRGTRR